MGNNCSTPNQETLVFYLYVLIPEFVECKKYKCDQKLYISRRVHNEVYQTLNRFSDEMCNLNNRGEIPTQDGLLVEPLVFKAVDITTTIVACEKTSDGCGYYWFGRQTSNLKTRDVLYCVRKNPMGDLDVNSKREFVDKIHKSFNRKPGPVRNTPSRSNRTPEYQQRAHGSTSSVTLPPIPMFSGTSRYAQHLPSSETVGQTSGGKPGTTAHQSSSVPKMNDGLPIDKKKPEDLVKEQNTEWYKENEIFDGVILSIDPTIGYKRHWPNTIFMRESEWRAKSADERQRMTRAHPNEIVVFANAATLKLLSNRLYRTYNCEYEHREEKPKCKYTDNIL